MSRYIDADELTEFYEPYKDMEVPVNALLEQIQDTSTVDVVKARHAKWQHYRDEDFYKDVYQCSECRFLVTGTLKMAYAYCPNCGAKMNEEKQENE